MPAKQQQQNISKTHQRRSQSKCKLYCIFLLLPVIISIVILLVVNNKISDKNNQDSSENNEVNSEVVSSYANRTANKRMSRSVLKRDSPNDYGFINVYIREACDEDRRSAYKKIRFPYAQYDRQRFRFSSSWMSVSRWMPIYVDGFTRQTFVYALEGVFIIPPLVNFHGESFSVAALLGSGHATLRSNHAAMPPYFDITHYIHTGKYSGENTPRFNSGIGSFVGGVQSSYRSYFQTKCENKYYDASDEEYLLAYGQSHNHKSNYYGKPRPRSRYSKATTPNTASPRKLPINPLKRNPRHTNKQETDSVDTHPLAATPSDENTPTTDSPDTNPVDTNPPYTYSPEANLPNTNSPDINQPDTNPSDTNLPGANQLDTNTPDVNPSGTNPLDTEIFETYAHATNLPYTNPPDTNSPDTNSENTNPLHTNLPDTNQLHTNTPDTNPLDANTPDTNPLDASPSETNPPGTNLPDINPLVTNSLDTNTPYVNQIDTYPTDAYLSDPNPLHTNTPDPNPSHTNTPDVNPADISSPHTNPQDVNPPNHDSPDTNPSQENLPETNSPIINPSNPDITRTPCDCSVLQGSSVLSPYNVMTLGNLHSISDIQGRAIICGSIIVDNALVFGSQLPSYFSAYEYALEIKDGPTVTGGLIQGNKGSVGVQCSQSSILYHGGTQYNVNGGIIEVQSFNEGARLYEDCDLVNRCSNLERSMKTLSSGLINLEPLPENILYKPTDDNNKLLFKVISTDCNKIAAFKGSFQNIIEMSSATTIHIETHISYSDLFVIINLSGTDIIWPSNIHLDGNWFNEEGRSRTIWNFYEATTITLYSNIKGFILAPYATVNLHANIHGSVAVNNLIGDAQVHLPNMELPNCI